MTGPVLVVDDSMTVRMDLAAAFEAAGYETVARGTIAEAREDLAARPFALVILDVLLPDGDGITLLEEIRARPIAAQPVVLMLSSEAEVKDRARGMHHGADDYVSKPYDADYVVARAGELIARRTPAPRPARPSILVIDDSLSFREGLREALLRDGYDVAVAANGEAGLRAAAAMRPTAIIVDGVMPGIDGITVVRRIRLDVALRATPCLLLTASEETGTELRALDAGADAFVRKEEDLAVILARLAAMLRRSEPDRGGAASALGPKRVLAVDDSATYRGELGERLRNEGFDVVLAQSGEEALELLAVQPVDCILLDLMMPGLSGQETCRRIKASPAVRDTPIIMLTALDDREAMINTLGTGADDYVLKSSEFEVLTARLRAQLRRKHFEDEHRRVRDDLLRSELEAAEARTLRQVAEARASLVEELARKNDELEAFSYSVSHDLRAPLRSIDGFSQAILEDCAATLDEQGRRHLTRIRAAAQRMAALIDDMLLLARVSRMEFRRERTDVSAIASAVLADLAAKEPKRRVDVSVEPCLAADADERLVRILLDNLLGNAWKFTGRAEAARIELAAETGEADTVFRVTDNGAGFDMAYASRLFQPFQRLHTESDFPGTGVGLATVRRIAERHGGRVWAESEVGRGTTMRFTLAPSRNRNEAGRETAGKVAP